MKMAWHSTAAESSITFAVWSIRLPGPPGLHQSEKVHPNNKKSSISGHWQCLGVVAVHTWCTYVLNCQILWLWMV